MTRDVLRLGLALAALVVAADQATKWWVRASLAAESDWIEVAGFFNLVTVWNRGVSFGMLGGGALPSWLLALFAGVIAVGLAVWLARVDTPWLGAAIGLIIGGAVGNVIDRLAWGAVFDFLDFHIGGYHWPAFNLADAAITIGVAVLLIDSLLNRRERNK